MRKLLRKILPKKVTAGLDVLETGKMVKDPVAWKKGQVTVEALSAFLWACVTALGVYFNVEVQVGEEVVNSASAALISGVAAAANLWAAISTVITTNKIGIEPDGSSNSEADSK